MKPWSYSTLTRFETCPRQYYEVKVAKNFIEVESEQQLWGKEVHTAFEDSIKSNGVIPLPEKMNQWQPLVDKVLAMSAREILAEVPVALDANFRAVDWDSEQCWTRGVIDLLVIGDTTAVVIDWKTGKRKPTQQLKLYAAYVFAMYPRVDVVHAAFAWLPSKQMDKESIARSEAPTIWQGFIERVARLRSAHERDSWPERPSGLCNGWCPVSTCQYWNARS